MAAVVVLLVVLAAGAAVIAAIVISGFFSSGTGQAPTRPAAANANVSDVARPRTRPRRSMVSTGAGSGGRVVVERDCRSLWLTRGWRRDGGRLVGAYRTPRGSAAGEIDIGLGLGQPEFYILNPPAGLLNGPHAACFRARGGGRYWIHFNLRHRDVDSGIAAIEALLMKALS